MATFEIDVAAGAPPERQPTADETAVLVFATQAAAPPDWWGPYFELLAAGFTDAQQPIALVVQPAGDGDITSFLPIAIALSAATQRRVQIDLVDGSAARVSAAAVVDFWTGGAEIVFGQHVVLALDLEVVTPQAAAALGAVLALVAEGPAEQLAALRARGFGALAYADFVRGPLSDAERACRLRSYDEGLAALNASEDGGPLELRPAGADLKMVEDVLAHPRTRALLGQAAPEVVVPSSLLPLVAAALGPRRVRLLLEGPVRDVDAYVLAAAGVDAAAIVLDATDSDEGGMTPGNWLVEALGRRQLAITAAAYEKALYFTATPAPQRSVPSATGRPPVHINVYGAPIDDFELFGNFCRAAGARQLRLVHTDSALAVAPNTFRLDLRHLENVDGIEVTSSCTLSFVGTSGTVQLRLLCDGDAPPLYVHVEATVQVRVSVLSAPSCGTVTRDDHITLEYAQLLYN